MLPAELSDHYRLTLELLVDAFEFIDEEAGVGWCLHGIPNIEFYRKIHCFLKKWSVTRSHTKIFYLVIHKKYARKKRILGPNVPPFEVPSREYSVTELFKLISEYVNLSKICVQKPSAVRTFASFLVDLKLKNLAADDNVIFTPSYVQSYQVAWQDTLIEAYCQVVGGGGV